MHSTEGAVTTYGRGATEGRALFVNNLDNNSNVNGNNNLNNSCSFLRITHAGKAFSIFPGISESRVGIMDPLQYTLLCSYQNLELAFKRARKGKTTKQYVIDFEASLKDNLLQLQSELLFHTYRPDHLQEFIIRDPKTRKINRSSFRDRVVHHALCNVIMPPLSRNFIFDSYANRTFKGTLKAIRRFEHFQRKVSHNFTRKAFVFKADIRHYFENVDHHLLLSILKRKISDARVLWLVRRILSNYSTSSGKGMPLGNLTSQFFANIYLNELDQFVKHTLKTEFYIRYVDDFVIFGSSKERLDEYKQRIDLFLQQKLVLELHPDKSRIIPLHRGTEFLGMKIFPYYKLIKKKNLRKFHRKLCQLCHNYQEKKVSYDLLYEFLEGWVAYARNANTYTLRRKILAFIESAFPDGISTKEINRHRKDEKWRLPLLPHHSSFGQNSLSALQSPRRHGL